MFLRSRYGEDRISELLSNHDADSAVFRSHVGPSPLDTLPERTLAFLVTHCNLCEAHAARRGLPFCQLLNSDWPGAGDVWRRVVEDQLLRLPRGRSG
jgi:hypothetical protein